MWHALAKKKMLNKSYHNMKDDSHYGVTQVLQYGSCPHQYSLGFIGQS